MSTPQPASSAAFVVGMLVHDDIVALDHVGPATIFKLCGATIHVIGASPRPVRTDIGLDVAPTMTFEQCPRDLDLIFVPGGLKGTLEAMSDSGVLAFLADRGGRAGHVASVCTGSLLLGAAGLLRGYRATSHWYARELLASMGATPSAERVTHDRNRITAAGATAGIDLALTICAQARGQAAAENAQLVLEYDPKPPFFAGSPATADPALVAAVLARRGPLLEQARQAVLAPSPYYID